MRKNEYEFRVEFPPRSQLFRTETGTQKMQAPYQIGLDTPCSPCWTQAQATVLQPFHFLIEHESSLTCQPKGRALLPTGLSLGSLRLRLSSGPACLTSMSLLVPLHGAHCHPVFPMGASWLISLLSCCFNGAPKYLGGCVGVIIPVLRVHTTFGGSKKGLEFS